MGCPSSSSPSPLPTLSSVGWGFNAIFYWKYCYLNALCCEFSSSARCHRGVVTPRLVRGVHFRPITPNTGDCRCLGRELTLRVWHHDHQHLFFLFFVFLRCSGCKLFCTYYSGLVSTREPTHILSALRCKWACRASTLHDVKTTPAALRGDVWPGWFCFGAASLHFTCNSLLTVLFGVFPSGDCKYYTDFTSLLHLDKRMKPNFQSRVALHENRLAESPIPIHSGQDMKNSRGEKNR